MTASRKAGAGHSRESLLSAISIRYKRGSSYERHQTIQQNHTGYCCDRTIDIPLDVGISGRLRRLAVVCEPPGTAVEINAGRPPIRHTSTVFTGKGTMTVLQPYSRTRPDPTSSTAIPSRYEFRKRRETRSIPIIFLFSHFIFIRLFKCHCSSPGSRVLPGDDFYTDTRRRNIRGDIVKSCGLGNVPSDHFLCRFLQFSVNKHSLF